MTQLVGGSRPLLSLATLHTWIFDSISRPLSHLFREVVEKSQTKYKKVWDTNMKSSTAHVNPQFLTEFLLMQRIKHS